MSGNGELGHHGMPTSGAWGEGGCGRAGMDGWLLTTGGYG